MIPCFSDGEQKKLSLVDTIFEWQAPHDSDANDCGSVKCDFLNDDNILLSLPFVMPTDPTYKYNNYS